VDIKPRLGGRSGTRRPPLVTAAVTPGWDGGDDDAMDRETGASQAVTALYEGHALGLTRIAFLMLGDRQTAEDVVQEAFCGGSEVHDPANHPPAGTRSCRRCPFP
jgi:hypothetical protein